MYLRIRRQHALGQTRHNTLWQIQILCPISFDSAHWHGMDGQQHLDIDALAQGQIFRRRGLVAGDHGRLCSFAFPGRHGGRRAGCVLDWAVGDRVSLDVEAFGLAN